MTTRHAHANSPSPHPSPSLLPAAAAVTVVLVLVVNPASSGPRCITTLGLSTSSGAPAALPLAFQELFTLLLDLLLDLCLRVLMYAFAWPCDCEGPNPSSKSSSNVTVANFPSLASPHGVVGSLGMATPGMAFAAAEGRFCTPRAAVQQLENWGDSLSGIVITSPLTETSTDLDDSGDKHHALMGGGGAGGGAHSQRRVGCVDSSERTGDEKTARRLAQNREAARKSRIRKKAYLAQLESSRSKLTHLEQELQRARQQGIFIAGGGSGDCSSGGALAFDLEYARWLDDHQRHINNLRVAVIADMGDDELRILVESVLLHYDEFFRLKNLATKSDVFHVLSGMWMSPAERFFMWLGGFRSSEILKSMDGKSHLPQLHAFKDSEWFSVIFKGTSKCAIVIAHLSDTIKYRKEKKKAKENYHTNLRIRSMP
ncbi:Transcription factor HBP-1b(c1) [Triticum urartu]|uniref:Transcription factor HBP-1b(C1) n=1 Tax=Triticum urartu TaxID=4572 RepID=M8AE94_TRIUA|nr:Transcription factor HBP-1b(c1) [Triticum urartu]